MPRSQDPYKIPFQVVCCGFCFGKAVFEGLPRKTTGASDSSGQTESKVASAFWVGSRLGRDLFRRGELTREKGAAQETQLQRLLARLGRATVAVSVRRHEAAQDLGAGAGEEGQTRCLPRKELSRNEAHSSAHPTWLSQAEAQGVRKRHN